MNNELTDEEKLEIIDDFKDYTGGFTPDECEVSDTPDNLEVTHDSYISGSLDFKFIKRLKEVREFLASYKS